MTTNDKNISAEKADEIMKNLLCGRSFSIDIWEGTKYERVKISSATDKGNLGEDLLKDLLEYLGYSVTLNKKRRGDWDIMVNHRNKVCKFEVKVATQDTNGSHQFNGIRHDTKYTHLFLLGIMPNELRYKIIAKKDRDNYTMTPMAKGANNAFKITLSSDQLESLADFASEIKALL